MLMWLTITQYILYVPSHGSMHLIGLNKMSTHVMAYEPMIKVLYTYIPINQVPKSYLIIASSYNL